jgi:acyl dehydratase
MGPVPTSTLLAHRFSEQDQTEFAQISGDANPLHTDPIEARRTLTGAPVVHGMHLVLLALETICANLDQSRRMARLYARFAHPLIVGETVDCRLVNSEGEHWRIECSVQGDSVLELRVDWAPRSNDHDADASVAPLQPVALNDPPFVELAGMAGSLQVGIDPLLARRLFPCLATRVGLVTLADLMALTRLVGMRCPGRHSLFGQLDVTFLPAKAAGVLHFQVKEIDERFSRVVVQVESDTLRGTLVAFYRPPPQPQPQLADLMKVTQRDEFSGSVALIVGGSRGLGEMTAKLLAAGGARVVVTYYRGEADAARVAAEIRSHGGWCECEQLDARNPVAGVERIFAMARPPRSIYYFATPHIFARRRGFFSLDLLQRFLQYYVFGFFQLIEAASRVQTRLRIFFPSTVAIDEHLSEIAEYSMAKQMAENLSAFYNRFSTEVEIITERLPRVKTDQTATLMDVPAEDAAAVMLPIIRHVELTGRQS